MDRGTLQVVGKGTVKYEPSTGIIILNVHAEDRTSVKAQEQLRNKLNVLIDKITNENNEFRVPLKNVKTTRQSLQPTYELKGKNNNRTLTGYKAYTTIMLTVNNVSDMGKLADLAVENGAEIGNIYFTEFNIEKYKNEATRKALQNAKEVSKLIATELGIGLGGIAGITTDLRYNNSHNDIRGMRFTASTAAFGISDQPSGTPIMPGEEEYECTVNVIFYITN